MPPLHFVVLDTARQPLPLSLRARRGCRPFQSSFSFDKLSSFLLAERAMFAAVSVGVWRHSSTFGDFIEVVPTHTAASGFVF
ncbi:MAG TPA: hypothetical protein DEP88_03365 [Verrucomicrobiales bacterium]|nr:hypothetical protein [Verrucomicrobiales bacterium]HCL96841.1 hypothetical protein [Verrucomicrobiales bacterium]